MSAFCHLLLNLFNSVGQKKKKNGNFSKETKSHDARDILRVSQSVSCNIIYIIIQSKPIFFDFCLNLSVIDSMKHQQGQTNSACEICQKPWKIQAWAWVFWNLSEAMKNSGLGIGFLARDKIKLKRLRSRLRLLFQGEVLFCFIWWT